METIFLNGSIIFSKQSNIFWKEFMKVYEKLKKPIDCKCNLEIFILVMYVSKKFFTRKSFFLFFILKSSS